MTADREFASSAFLIFRTLYPFKNITFSEKYIPKIYDENPDRKPVYNSFELEEELRKNIESAVNEGACIALSGGIDSAIMAKMMPKGSVAYTFQCVVPGAEVTDETQRAAMYAKECGLEHRIVQIYWENFQELAPKLMAYGGQPIHSIEVQIAKACLVAKSQGFRSMIFGESADINYGGLDSILSRDYSVSEFVERYSFLLPYKALKKPVMIMEPFLECETNGEIDVFKFLNHQNYCKSLGSYLNATGFAGINFVAPFSKTRLGVPLDFEKVRNGESKYFVREIFRRLYPGWEIPVKIPMPRPMNEWFKDWEGPKRDEFIPNCHRNLTGDQKWMVWALEKFLDMTD